jgi:hypothetical protein
VTTVVAVFCGSSLREAALARWQVVKRRRADRRRQGTAQNPVPAQRGDPGEDRASCREAERPPERAVCLLELDLAAGAVVAQLGQQPFGGAALALGGGRAVDRAQRLDQVPQPGLVECAPRLRWMAARRPA